MALIVDGRACAAIARRRAHGHEAALVVYIRGVRARRGVAVLAVAWAGRGPVRPAVALGVGDVLVYADQRVARYIRGRDVTISAWRVGPFERLWVVADLAVLLDLTRRQRTRAVRKRALIAGMRSSGVPATAAEGDAPASARASS